MYPGWHRCLCSPRLQKMVVTLWRQLREDSTCASGWELCCPTCALDMIDWAERPVTVSPAPERWRQSGNSASLLRSPLVRLQTGFCMLAAAEEAMWR